MSDHGTTARYWRGCRCDQCGAAVRDYGRARRRQLAYQAWSEPGPRLVPAEHAARVLRELRAAGWTWADMHRAGVAVSTVSDVLAGRLAHIRPTTLARIVALRGQPRPVALVPALASGRMVRSLAALGWSGREQASHSGAAMALIYALLRGDAPQRLQARTERRIRAMWDELQLRPGPSAQVAARARAAGWAPPLAWDEDDLANPNAKPRGVAA